MAKPANRIGRGGLAGALLATLSLALLAGPSLAQDTPTDPAAAAAQMAREAAEAALQAALAAERAAEEAPRPAPQPVLRRTSSAGPPPDDPGLDADIQDALEAARAATAAANRLEERQQRREEAAAASAELDQAIQDAEEAAREAREAARAARESIRLMEEQRKMRFARPGLVLGAGVLYAPEDFQESDIVVKSSVGVSALLGYRLHPHVGLEVRGEVLEGFDFSGGGQRGDVSTWSLSGNLSVYPLTGRIQPYATMGFGAVTAELEAEDRATGRSIGQDQETEAFGRFGAGIDFYLSEVLVWNVEAAYQGTGGDLDFLDYGILQTGLKLRLP